MPRAKTASTTTKAARTTKAAPAAPVEPSSPTDTTRSVQLGDAPDAVNAELEAVDTAAEGPEAARFGVGQLVRHTYRDPYAGAGGEAVSTVGVILRTETYEGDDGTVVHRHAVAWLQPSDPIAAAELEPA